MRPPGAAWLRPRGERPAPESAIRIVDARSDPYGDIAALGISPRVVVAVDIDKSPSEYWLERATCTLSEAASDDPRIITVDSIDAALAEIECRCARTPSAAALCVDVLRTVDPAGPVASGLVTESLAYSTLQSGPEFQHWLTARGAVSATPEVAEPVRVDRHGNTLRITLDRPHRHNAFDDRSRAALLDALLIARLDDSIEAIELTGNGPSFCSGGDLAEFGRFTDPPAAHLARIRFSPALALHELTERLGRNCRALVHGRALGSGLEMAAFCGWVTADPDTVFGLPELRLGLIPGAGGTVSVTRRIGRWRTGYLILSGRTISATTAYNWGLIDEVR